MVGSSSIQIVTFALPVSLQIVPLVSWSMRMRVELAALRNYARSRAISHNLRENPLSRPAVVQAPF